MENCQKEFEDMELEVFLNENKHKNNSLSNLALFNKLFLIGYDRWVPHELNDRQMEKRKNKSEISLTRSVQKEVVFVSFSYRR